MLGYCVIELGFARTPNGSIIATSDAWQLLGSKARVYFGHIFSC